ncbi:MAG: UDP-N-acetylglucosamine--N-acetylmuramyl-(pentapeptide) pyrophosphoryl-undecaprenol N-acetylglucosamine transferase [Chlamydiae bacterium]|nr:UDP-N-acetylglucosamine--N-acetylmuramyl-(pentapeptide) pyrophosphoryl-undecaprenol N-acetylglucosamine transferase [Chlamydiota bacterium]
MSTFQQTNAEEQAFSEKTLSPRIAVYTHDTFGLGHIRRCLNIIHQLSREMPHAAILLVTGSPALQYLKDLPSNVDIVKIPTIVKTGAKGSLPSHIPLGLPEIALLRSRIIRETILAYQPDVFMVDNFPLGAQSELFPLLKDLKPLHTKTILGLRDILDGPEVVRAGWKRQGVYDVLDRYYDKILIYGVQNIFDAVKEYAIPHKVAKKVCFCGYLTTNEPIARSPETIKEEYGVEGPLILATGGGGGDAFPLLSTLIEAVSYVKEGSTLIFTGPLMGEADRQELISQASGNPNIKIEEFVKDLRPYMLAADAVVTMCGYNIAAEIIHNGAKAIVVPRTWRFGEHSKRKQTWEDKEQIMRAEILAKYGLVKFLKPDELTPEKLAEKISETLSGSLPVPNVTKINVEGLQNAVRHIRETIS